MRGGCAVDSAVPPAACGVCGTWPGSSLCLVGSPWPPSAVASPPRAGPALLSADGPLPAWCVATPGRGRPPGGGPEGGAGTRAGGEDGPASPATLSLSVWASSLPASLALSSFFSRCTSPNMANVFLRTAWVDESSP